MRGHAAANLLPVVAANRVGEEVASSDQQLSMRFYGSSFISDHKGALLAEADRASSGVWLHDLDLAQMREDRLSWGMYRDRRPDMYALLLTWTAAPTHREGLSMPRRPSQLLAIAALLACAGAAQAEDRTPCACTTGPTILPKTRSSASPPKPVSR
jgi:hypothetical protein